MTLFIFKDSECKENEEVEYDEFGFRLDVEDGPEDSSNALVSAPFEEENDQAAAKRLKWIAQLEFAQQTAVDQGRKRNSQSSFNLGNSKFISQFSQENTTLFLIGEVFISNTDYTFCRLA
jgi:hypothetical protein